MREFKVGDRVRRVRGGSSGSMEEGDTGTIEKLALTDCTVITDKERQRICSDLENLELLIEEVTIKTIYMEYMEYMDIKQKVAMFFMNEPQKTFVEVGLANEKGELTPDGKEIFINFLLRKYGDDFKKEIADKLKENKEKK